MTETEFRTLAAGELAGFLSCDLQAGGGWRSAVEPAALHARPRESRVYHRTGMATPRSLAAGTVFAEDFRVVARLAAGGMGVVYVAEQLSTERQRALEVMHARIAEDTKSHERFVQEARVGSKIEEHVVEVIAAGVDAEAGAAWLAMELLEGQHLADVVQDRGRLPVAEVRAIFDQLCHGVGAAHAAGIVHRDLSRPIPPVGGPDGHNQGHSPSNHGEKLSKIETLNGSRSP